MFKKTMYIRQDGGMAMRKVCASMTGLRVGLWKVCASMTGLRDGYVEGVCFNDRIEGWFYGRCVLQ